MEHYISSARDTFKDKATIALWNGSRFPLSENICKSYPIGLSKISSNRTCMAVENILRLLAAVFSIFHSAIDLVLKQWNTRSVDGHNFLR
jgi:hypothetical protein